MSRLFAWMGGDKNKQGSRTGKTPERAEDALFEAVEAAHGGNIKSATKLFEESIRIYHGLGSKKEEAAATHAFAVSLAVASEFTPSFEAFNDAIALYRSLSLNAELARVLRDAGQAYADYSDADQSTVLLEESLSLYEALQDKRGVAGTLRALGRAAMHEEQPSEACKYYNRSREIYKDLGDSDLEALCLVCLSSVSVSQNDFDTAREHFYMSIDRYRSLAGASSMSATLAELGAAPFADKSYGLVAELLNAATSIYSYAQSSDGTDNTQSSTTRVTNTALSYNPDSHGSDSAAGQRAEASACLMLAPAAYNQDHQEMATALFEQAIGIANDLSDANLLCYSLLQAGSISSQHYDLPGARKYYAMLKEAAEAEEQQQYRAPALYASANAARQALELDSAAHDCEACLELYKSAGNLDSVARALTLYGSIKAEQGDTETGLNLLIESLELSRRSGDEVGALEALQCIGSVARAVDPIYARKCLEECVDFDGADGWRISTALQSLAELDLIEGEIATAFELSSKALSLRKELRDNAGAAISLELCAHVAVIWGDIETAVVLLSKYDSIQAKLGIPRRPEAQERYESNLTKLKNEIGAEDFTKAWSEGTALTLDEITAEIELMLEDVEPDEESEEDITEEDEQ